MKQWMFHTKVFASWFYGVFTQIHNAMMAVMIALATLFH